MSERAIPPVQQAGSRSEFPSAPNRNLGKRDPAHASQPSSGALRQAMQDTFGISTLRPGQQQVIDSVLQRRDTLAIMPSGAGKSLCYQLPALKMPGVTVVVSPLIALMKDQAEKLEDAGVG